MIYNSAHGLPMSQVVNVCLCVCVCVGGVMGGCDPLID